jgi:DNA-binding response OmpR family regulator
MSPKNEDTLVLVADDEPSMLALLSAYIRSKGYRVLEASDGDMAWQLAHQHLPHAVVLDVMMPGMSGWEVCKKIRESVSLAHTGVVMLTGIGESLNELTSPLYGADAYIDKPFEFAELEARIRETLERRRAGTLGRPDGGSDEDAGEAPKSDDDDSDDSDDSDDDSDGPDSFEPGGSKDDEPITQRLAKLSRKKAKVVRKPKAAREDSDADSSTPEPKRAGKKKAAKKKAAKAAAKPAAKVAKKAGKKKAAKKAAVKPAAKVAKKAGKKKAAKKAVGGKKKSAKKAPAKAPVAKKAAKKAGKKKAKKSGKR